MSLDIELYSAAKAAIVVRPVLLKSLRGLVDRRFLPLRRLAAELHLPFDVVRLAVETLQRLELVRVMQKQWVVTALGRQLVREVCQGLIERQASSRMIFFKQISLLEPQGETEGSRLSYSSHFEAKSPIFLNLFGQPAGWTGIKEKSFVMRKTKLQVIETGFKRLPSRPSVERLNLVWEATVRKRFSDEEFRGAGLANRWRGYALRPHPLAYDKVPVIVRSVEKQIHRALLSKRRIHA